MAERSAHRRARLAAAWALTAILLGGYYLVGRDDGDGPAPAAPTAPKCDEKGELEIVEVVPGEPTPGSALEIRHACGKPDLDAPVVARLSLSQGGDLPALKWDLEVLHSKPGELVVRVPNDLRPARYKLRIQQGAADENEKNPTRSKPYDLRVKSLSRQKLFRSVIGGLALLVFGLRTMSSGSRAYTGHRSQGVLAGIGRRTSAAVGIGVAVGGLTQFTTTAAGLVVGLIESHLLGAAAGAAILLGAQLGSAAAPTLIGLASTGKEGLLVVTVGVLWLSLAPDRRSNAFGKIILGCGLLFYGLYLLRDGFGPLVSDPELLPYIHLFQASTAAGLVSCVLLGAALAAVLQGPGPVFALVLSLTQATGAIDLRSALAILAGTGIGAAVGTTVVAWPFGRKARQVAYLHLMLAGAGTVLLALTLGVWHQVSDLLVTGQPGEIMYGKKVALPHIGRHLAIGFVLSQAAVTLVLAVALPLATRLLTRLSPPEPARTAPALDGEAGIRALREGLVRVLGFHRRALLAVMDLCLTGHRARGGESEHALADARAELEALFAGAVRTRSEDPELARLRQSALSTLQLQRAMEDLLAHAERSTERAMALSPAGDAWQLASSDAATLKALHELLLQGMDALVQQLASGAPPDIDAARSREIRLNALEMDARQGLLQDADRGVEAHSVALRLNTTDLVNAYEHVGNHLYRLSEALASEVEQDAAE